MFHASQRLLRADVPCWPRRVFPRHSLGFPTPVPPTGRTRSLGRRGKPVERTSNVYLPAWELRLRLRSEPNILRLPCATTPRALPPRVTPFILCGFVSLHLFPHPLAQLSAAVYSAFFTRNLLFGRFSLQGHARYAHLRQQKRLKASAHTIEIRSFLLSPTPANRSLRVLGW